jgi:hypothetical protein
VQLWLRNLASPVVVVAAGAAVYVVAVVLSHAAGRRPSFR